MSARKPTYAPGNTDENGDYIVGKGRAPNATRFAPGDGRPRGRRAKGQRNLDTILAEEANRKIVIREGGKERRVTKLEAIVIRAFDNASAKGQTSAITFLLNLFAMLMDKNKPLAEPQLELGDQALVDAWIIRRMAELGPTGDDGDPDELAQTSENPAAETDALLDDDDE